MDRSISPRSSTTSFRTTSTAESHEPRPRSEFPRDARRPPTSASYFPHYYDPFQERNRDSNSTSERRESIPYAELERQEREEEERASQASRNSKTDPKRLSGVRQESHLNAHSECGRHGDDWLFGGKSITDGVKWLFGKK